VRHRLGILCTHPIQYYAPLFRLLEQNSYVECTVYYAQKPDAVRQGVGFGVAFEWDVDLTGGYRHMWLKNKAARPDLASFSGCDTPEIAAIIRREKFDAFLVTGWNTKSHWQAMHACWSTGTPVFVRSDSHLHKKRDFLKEIVKRATYPLFMKRFAACLAVGRWSGEYFAHYGARRVLQSPHFVDNEWFASACSESRQSAARLRRDWGIPENSTTFLFVGKFEPKKRPMDLLEAFKKMLSGAVELRPHLFMVGDGQKKRECEDYASRHALPVSFGGFLNQSKMPLAYAVCDALVLPSDGRETWGLVVNEAMACGLPVIVSDEVGAGPDLVMPGKTGYVFRCGDIDALAERMREMLIPDKCRTLGQAARERVASFSPQAALKGILQAMDLGV